MFETDFSRHNKFWAHKKN